MNHLLRFEAGKQVHRCLLRSSCWFLSPWSLLCILCQVFLFRSALELFGVVISEAVTSFPDVYFCLLVFDCSVVGLYGACLRRVIIFHPYCMILKCLLHVLHLNSGNCSNNVYSHPTVTLDCTFLWQYEGVFKFLYSLWNMYLWIWNIFGMICHMFPVKHVVIWIREIW